METTTPTIPEATQSSTEVILLLGAGASKPVGYPTTEGFIDEVEDQLEDDLLDVWNAITESRHVGTLDDVFDEINAVTPEDELTSGSSLGKYLGRSVGSSIEDPIESTSLEINQDTLVPGNAPRTVTGATVRNAFKEYNRLEERLIELIYEIYGWDYTIPEQQSKHPLTPYIKATSRLNGGGAHIFTTNYDMAVESLARGSYGVVDMFLGPLTSSGPRPWDGHLQELGPDTIGLYKLHGSVDWVKEENGVSRDGTFTTRGAHPGTDREELIPPGRTPSDKLREEPYRTYYSLFDELLESCDTVVSIGYSFLDDDIRERVKQSGANVVLVQPDAKPAAKRLAGDRLDVHPIEAKMEDDKAIQEVKRGLDARLDATY